MKRSIEMSLMGMAKRRQYINKQRLTAVFGIAFFSTGFWLYRSRNFEENLLRAPVYIGHNVSSSLYLNHVEVFRKVTIPEIHDRFRHRTLNSCVNKCNPLETMCNVTTQSGWVKFNNAHKLSLVPLHHENEIIFPWEEDFFSMQPLTDVRTLPDLEKSDIRLLANGSVQTSKNVTCQLAQTLTFRLDLYDSNGSARNGGRDEVRAWISGKSRNGESYRAAGEVVDMKNGSYEIRVKCLWAGSIQLKVGVVYPREYLRLAFHHDRIGSYAFVNGFFQRGIAKEVTICLSLPNVPGRPCLCNFTRSNSLPFYCGKPVDSRLSCNDLKATSRPREGHVKDYTTAEAKMAANMSRHLSKTLVRHDLHITAVPGANNSDVMSSPPTACDASLMADTWSKGYPRGFFNSGNRWISLICKEQNFDQSKAAKCLRNATILLNGDSNMERMFTSFRNLVGCSHNMTVRGEKPIWATPATCRNESINLNMNFWPHEQPLYQGGWSPLELFGGIAKAVDLIPSHGKHILLYHFYLHPALSHLSSTFLGLTNAKKSIKRLLHRNPRVLVGVRGPHVTSIEAQTNHLFGGDVRGSFAHAMYKDVFMELWDRIVFLDGWELTTAIENPTLHPSSYVPDALVRTFLSFFCDS